MAEEAVPITPSLWSSVLLSEGGEVKEDYEICYIPFEVEGEATDCQVIPITIVQRKLLVAVPFGAWSRQVSERVLPRTAITKAVLVEIEGVAFDDLGIPDPAETRSCKAWVGFLRGDLARAGQVGEPEEPGALEFGDEADSKVKPYAMALVELANEHFAFFSARSANGEGGDQEDEVSVGHQPGSIDARMARLEESMAGIQAALKNLGGASGAKDGGATTAKLKKALPGLDAGVVASARQAGIGDDQLQRLSSLLVKPNRMEERPGGYPSRKKTVLSESEEDEIEEVAEDAGEDAGEKAGGPVEQAVVKLTKLMTTLTKEKSSRRGLDAILERVDVGGGEGSSSAVGSGKSKAAAFKKLKAALESKPEWLYTNIEALMEEDFNLVRAMPGSTNRPVSSRAWLEHRSKLLHYPSTIRTSWIIGGIHDALKEGRTSEARARCALALGAIDQSSLDNGSWTLAQEVLLEAPAPYASFIGRKNPDLAEQAVSKLLDERLVEILLWRLKERDSYIESRKRLGAVGRGKVLEVPIPIPKPKGQPKAKAKSRGQGSGSYNQEEAGQPAE